jgi:N6-adenosine-specific RNA methylase IME4
LTKYACILADPPWRFATWSGERAVSARAQAGDPYPTMTLADLRAMRIGEALAARDAVLFLWVVDAHFAEAWSLLRAWGFAYKTVAFVWVKTTLDGRSPKMGMGKWRRGESEQCWLATRGRPRVLAHDVRQVIVAPLREHSRKPDEQYARIERLAAGPRIELFARERRRGWAARGDQTDLRPRSALLDPFRGAEGLTPEDLR